MPGPEPARPSTLALLISSLDHVANVILSKVIEPQQSADIHELRLDHLDMGACSTRLMARALINDRPTNLDLQMSFKHLSNVSHHPMKFRP